jgi:hypothetical protein
MRVTDRDLDRIPAGNLRVSREEFGALWAAAEEHAMAQAARGITDWHSGGVLITCRWLARAVTEFNGHRQLASRPVTPGNRLAFEELIEAEYLAVETLAVRRPAPLLVTSRPGYVDAVRATLRWAWRRNGPVPVIPPISVGAAD